MAMLFSITAFVGAFLLFAVQPMVGKMILPLLGGVPAVWTTCMLFFQALLLVGYAYAHAITRTLGPRAPVVHIGLIAGTCLALPIGVEIIGGAEMAPETSLLRGLAIGVGLPFFALAATAPLLQSWYANTGAPSAEDPYFLYAASNAGSLIALLSYPLLIEQQLDLDSQQDAWTIGYVSLVVLLLCVATVSIRRRTANSSNRPSTPLVDVARRSSPTLQVVLAFVPSVLLLGVTTHLTTDVAAMPLLWVAPLSIYLVTFILAFARRQVLTTEWARRFFFPLSVLSLLLIHVRVPGLQYVTMSLLLATLFFGSAVCHLTLAGLRPPAAGLTGYFARIGAGGALGGVFCALLAPRLFDSVGELPLAIVLVVFVHAASDKAHPISRNKFDLLAAPVALALMTLGALVGKSVGQGDQLRTLILVFGLPAGLAWVVRRRSLAFAAVLAATAIGFSQYAEYASSDIQFAERGFFGTVRVVDDGPFRLMVHGSTIHGAERVRGEEAALLAENHLVPQPLTYFDRSGPLGQVFQALHARVEEPHVLVAGLGVGAVAAYAHPAGSMTFLEVDPTVAKIAEDPDWFHFLSHAKGEVSVKLGDARGLIAEESDREFDLILLDAFGSDSIPAHLVTEEALDLYLDRLASGGSLVFNLTNRFVDLLPMLTRLADQAGLHARVRSRIAVSEKDRARLVLPCRFLVLTRTAEALGAIRVDSRWERPPVDPTVRIWTDRYSSLIPALRW